MAKLELQNISFAYGKNQVLKHIGFTLENGVVALLGPNGAGKTTLINIIMGIFEPDSGSVLFNEDNIKKLKTGYYEHVGYLPQMPMFYQNFTAYKFLQYVACLKDIPKKEAGKRIEKLLELVNLTDKKNTKVGTFSGGMKQRLGIAQAMLNDPDILILDEPTAGLDPSERIRFRNIISQIGNSKIVILATHIVSDVECIAGKAIFLKENSAILFQNLNRLTKEIDSMVWKVKVGSESESNRITEKLMVSNIRQTEDLQYELRIISGENPFEDCVQDTPGLEDVFLYYYNQ